MAVTKAFSDRTGAHVHIHTAEIIGEETATVDRTGLREIEYLDSFGLITPRIVCAHCVYLDTNEIDILARGRGNVAHCPQANLYLASGIAPIPEMLSRGANDPARCEGGPRDGHPRRRAVHVPSERSGVGGVGIVS